MDGDLVAHPEQELEDEPGSAEAFRVFENKHALPEPKWVVTHPPLRRWKGPYRLGNLLIFSAWLSPSTLSGATTVGYGEGLPTALLN
jgi:hypothetical protein